ncbi:MAG: GTP cyclohydrolase [Desulfotalea sp.]|nr:MAG: GTP cyclohydrolase [Desulfotalea sp.]
MFIVSLTYKAELSEVDKHIDDHIVYLEKYYTLGKFIASGRKVPRIGGIILVKAANKAEVDTIIKEDPFNIANVASYDVTEFIPTMASKEFEAIKSCT